MTAFQRNIQPITLKYSLQQVLGKHLLSCYPHEACGVLLGTAAAGGMLIDTYVPMRNVAPDPLHNFTPHPEDWIRILFNESAIIGLFHSHPHSAPIPSAADYNGLTALGNEFKIYLIGSPGTHKDHPDLNAYYIERLSDHSSKITPTLSQAPLHVLLK